MYKFTLVDNQEYANRARFHIWNFMMQRDMSGNKGLPSMTGKGLYNFMAGHSDIRLCTLQNIAKDLGVEMLMLLQPIPGGRDR